MSIRGASSLVPLMFVLLWSSGFISSKLGVAYAEPFTFLTLRYSLVLMILLPVALLMRAPWPQGKRQLVHVAIAGVLTHAVYLSGCVWALRLGLPAGLVSLIVSMQPLLTAAFAGVTLGEQVFPRQWAGLAMGFLGTAMVVAHKMGGGLTLPMILPALFSLMGITAGTMWQKRHCPQFDLRTGSVVQYAASLLLTAPLAFLTTGTLQVQWSGQFVFALLWAALVLSIGAISLLNFLIRSGSAVHVASLFYTVPAVTALMAWGIFGETLGGMSMAGMVVAGMGVWLARRKQGASA